MGLEAVLSHSLCGGLAVHRGSPTHAMLGRGRLLSVSSSYNLNKILFKERKASFGGIISICTLIEETNADNERDKDIKSESLPNTARSGPARLLQCIENTAKNLLPPAIPSQQVADTSSSLLFSFLVGILLFMDYIRLFKLQGVRFEAFQIHKLQPYEMLTASYTFIFLMSAVISALLGCMCIPFLRRLKAYQILRKEGPTTHISKSGTSTMGGVYFIPVGVTIAAIATHTSSVQLSGLVAATLVFSAIGLLDDILGLIKKHNYGLPWWCKLSLQVIAGIGFSYWHEFTCLAAPFRVKTLVLFPKPLSHLDLGNWYQLFTAFCFASMSNGVNLTDGLDGLAAGTAAAAFLGMTLAMSHIYPAVAIFGVSMAGACVGFLVHNHHKAVVFMGDTGSLALGGALAAMAASTGMFLPLLICSGIFFVETVSVILQVSYKRWTKKQTGFPKKLFRMAPIHHHFELGGMKEPTIVAVAYAVSCLLALLGGYVGLKCIR